MPAYMNGLETMTLTKKQQEKVKICEKQPGKNNIVGDKRADKRKWMK